VISEKHLNNVINIYINTNIDNNGSSKVTGFHMECIFLETYILGCMGFSFSPIFFY